MWRIILSSLVITICGLAQGYGSEVEHALKYGASPEACRSQMTKQGYKSLRDSTIVLVYPTRPLPQVEKVVDKLGLDGPYGYQIWEKKNVIVILHFACAKSLTKDSKQNEFEKKTDIKMMLIWRESKEKREIKQIWGQY